MELLTLTNLKPAKGARKAKKRVGRGIGTGHGKTSSRGQKGQHARDNIRPGFEGGQTPLYRRLPKLRGQGKGAMPLGPTRKFYAIINLSQLGRFDAGSTVSESEFRAHGMIKGEYDGLRILGNGELDKAITIRAHHFTATAKEKIEAAGGTAEVISKAIQKS